MLSELEGLAEEAYASAGVDPPDVVALAFALLGPDAIVRDQRPMSGPAALVGRSIVIARAATPFDVAHELGHFLIRRAGLLIEDEEAAANYLAGALLAPRRTFREALRTVGHRLPELAEMFAMTETAAALRIGEVEGTPIAVVAPRHVRVRGPESWQWPDERTLRAWARARELPGITKIRLRDDPHRIVLAVDE